MESKLTENILPFHSVAIGCVNPRAHDAGKECFNSWRPDPARERCQACHGEGSMNVLGKDVPCYACGGTMEHDDVAMAYIKEKLWL